MSGSRMGTYMRILTVMIFVLLLMPQWNFASPVAGCHCHGHGGHGHHHHHHGHGTSTYTIEAGNYSLYTHSVDLSVHGTYISENYILHVPLNFSCYLPGDTPWYYSVRVVSCPTALPGLRYHARLTPVESCISSQG